MSFQLLVMPGSESLTIVLEMLELIVDLKKKNNSVQEWKFSRNSCGYLLLTLVPHDENYTALLWQGISSLFDLGFLIL